MWWMRRRASVAKKTAPNETQTIAIRMSTNHSGSAYSLPCVMPKGIVVIASTQTSCQPQNVNRASPFHASRVCPVRCTT
ncbi:MAG: hypothetical protein GHHEDOFH_02331 [Pseudorhodoplanes sp.]|nr:hypothetical protein [Pseudorhodoplanes sp.]